MSAGRMPLWRLEPVADPGDSRWLDHEIWRQVVVRAPSAALARSVASELEGRSAAPAGNESLSFQSAFADEKLYHVVRLGPEEADAFGPGEGLPAVLHQVKAAGDRTAP